MALASPARRPGLPPTRPRLRAASDSQNANGTLALANFTDFMPGISVKWILNPGQVVYDIIASKRRLEAADQQEQAATQETIRLAAVQYYDLVLAQARVSVTRQATEEAGELLRIERLRLRTGNGLPADELPAEAALANARQDLVTALNAFYEVSVSLAVTLHLDATIMLIPQSGAMKQSQLVRDDLDITEMLATATRYRPDLEAVRKLLQAAKADKGATIWGELGPQFQASYSFAGLAAHTTGQDDALRTQQKAAGSAGFVLGASTYGQINNATANRNVASLNVESRLDQIRAAVVSAHQACITAAKLIPIAVQQLAFAKEALRLTQESLKSGTGLTVDVLQAEDAAAQARYRYATAIVRYNQSEVNLLAALGLIDQATLLPVTAASPPAPD
jgi:outer membrane protein TolC